MCTQYSLLTSPTYLSYFTKPKEKCCENKCSQSEKRVDKEKKKNPIFSRRHEQRSINLWNRFGFSQWIFAKHFGKSIAISASVMIEVEALTISNSCQFMKKKFKYHYGTFAAHDFTGIYSGGFELVGKKFSTSTQKFLKHVFWCKWM